MISAVALAIVCLVFVLLGHLIVRFYAVLIENTSAPDGGAAFSIRASIKNSQELNLDFPPNIAVSCRAYDLPGRPETRANLNMIDVDGKTPRWQATNFVYPQRFEMKCVPVSLLTPFTLRPSPATIDVLYQNRRMDYEKYLCVAGVLLWLVSQLVLRFRSR